MRYFHDVNSIVKKEIKGGNDDNLYQNICFDHV
jgi:hypothetical protein